MNENKIKNKTYFLNPELQRSGIVTLNIKIISTSVSDAKNVQYKYSQCYIMDFVTT